MKVPKQEIRQAQELRRELHRVGYRNRLNELASKLQVMEGMTAVSESARRLHLWSLDMVAREKHGTPPDPRRVLKFFLLDSDLA